MSSDTFCLYRLRVTTDADPGSLARVLERFQNLNVLPRRVLAEHSSEARLHIHIDVGGLSEAMMCLIAGKVAQSVCVLDTHWHRL
jgi:hypothetical protein